MSSYFQMHNSSSNVLETHFSRWILRDQ